MVTIRLDGLGAFHGTRLVLSDVSTPIFRGGEVVAVIGPNAAGKSTLFKRIAGLLKGPGRRLPRGSGEGTGRHLLHAAGFGSQRGADRL